MQPLIPLESIQIASPCRAEWGAMQPVRGQDCIRFCQSCGKNVYDLSGLTRDEGMRLMAEKEGRLCLRIHRRSDGTVITSDCPVGQAASQKRGRMAALFATIAGFGAAVFGMGSVLLNRPPTPPKPLPLTPNVLSPNPLIARAPVQSLPSTPVAIKREPVLEVNPPTPIESVTVTNGPQTDTSGWVTMGAPMRPTPTPIPLPKSPDKSEL